MNKFLETDTVKGLNSDQLMDLASSRDDILVDYLEHETVFDAKKIRLLLELGRIEAKRRFELLQ